MATVKKKIKVSAVLDCCGGDDWQTQDDFRTLCRAKEIECDKKRMDKVREYAKAQMLSAASIATDDLGGEDD